MEYLSPYEWKDVFTSSLKQTSRIAAGLDGGFVFIGGHTSRMSKATMSDLLDLIAAFGAQHNIQFEAAAA